MDNHDIKALVKEFLANASQSEINEFHSLLKQREALGPRLDINPQQMASQMARNLRKQMGLTKETIKKTAKDLIIQLALQKSPHISKKQLMTLVNHMMPDERFKQIRKRIPKPVLKSMTLQIVLYATNRMTDNEKMELPEGWLEKYLNILPETVRKILTAFLKNEIDEDQFLKMLDTAVNMD